MKSKYMERRYLFWVAMVFFVFVMNKAWAIEDIGVKGPQHKVIDTRVNDCAPASDEVDMDINNVRARLLGSGDMWWDLVATARYIVPNVPKGSGLPEVSSLFAGAVWIGGIDANGQLKVAAQTYRQNGNDYFPGPLDATGNTDASTCVAWDKHYIVHGDTISHFLDLIAANNGSITDDLVPQELKDWPAYGNNDNTLVGNRNLAPFVDVNGDGVYDPTSGDYPAVDPAHQTYADEMIWWCYNDKGNIHSETGALAIGIEIHALAFAFKTNDEINDMTFYNYDILNKATVELDSAFMGQWVDPDLGCYVDDYIGCNVLDGLGIVYNSKAIDGGSACAVSYGDWPPYEGIDYFESPKNQFGVPLGMSSFLYYNNDFTVLGNPENAGDYYGYMSGTWKDATPFTFGGDAYGGSTPTKYVFPDDPSNPKGWSECSQNDQAGDRRMMINSGPFILEPGADNHIVDGVVWVRPPIGTYPCPKYDLLLEADQKAQTLFNTGFKLITGPNAPDLSIIELSRQLIVSLTNTNNSKVEQFSEADPTAVSLGAADSLYKFQGYQVYQLANQNVSPSQFGDPTQARLIFQEDIKDGVGKIINYVTDPSTNLEVPVLEVNGADAGIVHSFPVKFDAFATGDRALVNYKSYFFSVISYAYNNYSVTDTIRDSTGKVINTVVHSQKTAYLAGLKNVKTYEAIPHITTAENGGTILQSQYGDGPELTRLEGTGNGVLITDLTQQSVEALLQSSSSMDENQTYMSSLGPVSIKVYNPLVVPSDSFNFSLVDTANTGANVMNASSTKWIMQNISTGETVKSDFPISVQNDQLITDWGLSVFVQQSTNPAPFVNGQVRNTLLKWSITYADPQKAWLSGVPNSPGDDQLHWIRAGTYYVALAQFPDYKYVDDGQVFVNLFGGTWAPYQTASSDPGQWIAPAWNDPASHGNTAFNNMDSMTSFEFVFTPDTSKWSQCIVIEENQSDLLSDGAAGKCDLRDAYSLNKDGSVNTSEKGRSWFPGYAFNPETGQRLNIFFGEDSWLKSENGADMLWDPTSNIISPSFTPLMGGQHYIYVTRTKYDGCTQLHTLLSSKQAADKRLAYEKVCWVGAPLLAQGFNFLPLSQGLIPTETDLMVRVTKPYAKFITDVNANNGYPHYGFSTHSLAAKTGDNPIAIQSLDSIRAVPNPYYAYSGYEQQQLDNIVKITNLPTKCTVTIYTLSGSLVRKYNIDDPEIQRLGLNWDLKNQGGIAIASGIYLIHVDAPGIGEKTIKWFGILRPTDLNAY